MESETLYPEISQEQGKAFGWEVKKLRGAMNPSDEFISSYKERFNRKKSGPLSGEFDVTVRNESRTNMKSRRSRKEFFDIFVEYWCSSAPLNLRRLINDVERDVIIKVLGRVNGNQRIAAKALGINPTTLNEKLKKFGIYLRKAPFIEK